MSTIEKQGIEFTRINNDVNGNPRYVCHYLNFIKDSELREIWADYATCEHISKGYELAIARAKKIGGRKFHNKQYGGGIVFQSYNLNETAKQIVELKTA